MKLLMLLCLSLLASPARCDDVFAHPISGRQLLATILAEPSRALAKTQVLQGRFVHRKALSELPKPLVSTGEFLFARDLGVYWRTREPFDSAFVLTRQGVSQTDEGVETMRISVDQQPAVRVIGRIFFALFALDVDALSGGFDLFAAPRVEPSNETWTIGLKPKSGAVANVFIRATVSGRRDVEQVTLTDKHGDTTTIDLSAVEHSVAAPSAMVRALFEH